MKENNDFLEDRYVKEGKTNLGVYFIRYRDEQMRIKVTGGTDPQAIMIPPTAREEAGQPPILSQPHVLQPPILQQQFAPPP